MRTVGVVDTAELCDRQEITDLITAYTRAVDTGDFDRLAHVFTEDAVLDYSDVDGPVGPPADVVPWMRQGLAGFARYQHLLGQVEIAFAEADGDRPPESARATAYFTNPLVAVAEDGSEVVWHVGGYYHHTLRRTPDGWRSVHLVDENVWMGAG